MDPHRLLYTIKTTARDKNLDVSANDSLSNIMHNYTCTVDVIYIYSVLHSYYNIIVKQDLIMLPTFRLDCTSLLQGNIQHIGE